METKKINVYSLNELEEEIKQKVLKRFREEENFWFLKEELKEELKQKLFKNKINYFDDLKISYSLNYSQGDGFCFYGTFEKDNITYKIKPDGHYSHYNSKEIYAYNDEGEEIEDTEDFNILFISICKELETTGYEIMEETLKDKNLIETIEDNDYVFFKNGEIANNYLED